MPPSLSDLMARYVQRQAEAQAAGLATFDLSGEVVPYEAGPVQPIDAKPAWTEAIAAAVHFDPALARQTWKVPPAWPQLVAASEPAFDLAFCLGNFPQMVRNLHPLMQAKDLSELRQTGPVPPIAAPALTEWAEKAAAQAKYPEAILAVAALRLARQYDAAAKLAAKLDAGLPEKWRPLWENEKAALAWHRGDVEAAAKAWQSLPESVPVLFNRGMAALFLGRADEAIDPLTRAVAQLPENSAWHHLARLYLTLAEAGA